MKVSRFFEDAQWDVKRSKRADDIFQKIKGHLYKLDKAETPLPMVEFEGEDMPCLFLNIFDQGYFADTGFIFKPSDYAMTGKALAQKPHGGTYRYWVIVEVDGGTPGEILKSLRYSRVDLVVRHELQHIIDYKRYKVNFALRGKKLAKGEVDPVQYHNDPLEQNAYFHNLAEPLLHRLRFMEQHGEDQVGIFDPLPKDFRAYLLDHLTPRYGILKKHWDALSENKRRRAISRTKQLFDLFWERAAKYVNNEQETPD